MMRRVLAMLLLAGAAMPTQARNFGDHGGYEVSGKESAPGKPGFCIMMEEFEGPGDTRLYMTRQIDKPEIILVAIANQNWSSKEDEKYPDFSYELSGGTYDREVFGVKLDYVWKGFMTGFPYPEFMKNFAVSSYLHIRRGETIVDKLSMEGSTAAKKGLETCWTWLLADDVAKRGEWSRYSDIPKDPFNATNPANTAEPIGPLAALFRYSDYPLGLRASRVAGTTQYQLTIDAYGRVQNCAIVASSGSAELDKITCRILDERASFHPRAGRYTGSVTWSPEI